ncbi:phosphoserine phosphatase SerB [Rhodospirillaceae bacterium KN72]|uniref:Phosphoserine phosphatase n=1 Tax=Pacificispira spongiicola TaxID=2729598 RepID=A0A7Y0HG73_9PROT|nr:phosphoserine phosphatase SerB [Pacificispira spongiicola]NMM44617.1 phosphoserine phosphatase SerB [Pacificispira spongiicola]
MLTVITLVADGDTTALTQDHIDAAKEAAHLTWAKPSDEIRWLAHGRAAEFHCNGADADRIAHALDASTGLDRIDRAVQPAENRRKRVLVADMDSTMIQIETLDTMAAELGIGEEVAEITTRSMAGEMDFVESLRARVDLLKGFEAAPAMAKVMDQVVHTSGAETAVKTMAANGCLCALVSGGFTFTTEVVHKALGFQQHAANTLEIDDNGLFTGGLTGPIVGRPTKLEILSALCERQSVDLSRAAAIGDGANDLDMLKAAGLGIGFYPKPIVRREARFRIEFTDMTTLAFYQGYGSEDFVS